MSDVQTALPNPNPEGSELAPEQSVPIDPASLARHYEQEDVNIQAMVRFAIIVFVGIVVASTVLAVALRVWSPDRLELEVQLPPARVTPPVVPGPGLDAAPEVNLQEIMRRDNERLHTYGWVDREAGIVHIPIEEAMQMLVDRGLPAREGDAPSFAPDPAFRMDGSGGLRSGEWNTGLSGGAGEDE
jgi:hypothetical protein